MATTAAPRALRRPPPALHEFGYWLHRYRRTWRGTVVISVANPLLFLAALGAGLGKLVDRGGSGYLHGTEVERHYRDARILPIGGGAIEVMSDLAARLLGYDR